MHGCVASHCRLPGCEASLVQLTVPVPTLNVIGPDVSSEPENAVLFSYCAPPARPGSGEMFAESTHCVPFGGENPKCGSSHVNDDGWSWHRCAVTLNRPCPLGTSTWYVMVWPSTSPSDGVTVSDAPERAGIGPFGGVAPAGAASTPRVPALSAAARTANHA